MSTWVKFNKDWGLGLEVDWNDKYEIEIFSVGEVTAHMLGAVLLNISEQASTHYQTLLSLVY